MRSETVKLKKGESLDDLLKGKLSIIQKIEGYRFSIDPILLAGFAHIKRCDLVADLGAGSGVISLILAYRHRQIKITGIEIDAEQADMASRSLTLGSLNKRAAIIKGDLKEIKSLSPPEIYSVVVANPPYGKATSGRINPDEKIAAARHEIRGGLYDFLKAAAYLLKYRGRVNLIYPARRLADLIYDMRMTGIEPKRLRSVHSNRGEPAKLVLLEGVKGGGVEMKVMDPLYIYDGKGNYSKEVEGMYE